MKRTLLHFTMLIAFIFSCNAGYAQKDKITFTWKGNGDKTKRFSLVSTGLTKCTIDWGNGFIENNNGGSFISPAYGDNEDYTVVVEPVSEDERFVSFNISGDNVSLNNEVSELDVRNAKKLNFISCGYNRLTSLDLSDNQELELLYCYSNDLLELDLSKNSKLSRVDCSSNKIKIFDITGNLLLSRLYCGGNDLETLKIGENINLRELYCSSNKLSELNLKNLQGLVELGASFNSIEALELSGLTDLTTLYCEGNKLTSLDLSKNTQLTLLACANNPFNDLKLGELKDLTTLKCSKSNLTTLDLKEIKNISVLECNDNKLTSLDLSNNTQLTRLVCYNNELTALDLSHNLDLSFLWCWTNKLTELNLSHNEQLAELVCSGNQLTSLIVSDDARLSSIECTYNQLSLSDLYKVSQQLISLNRAYMGRQSWNTVTIPKGVTVDLSDQIEFGGILTNFNVKKSFSAAEVDVDYTFQDNKMTFLTTGNYTVEMTNSAIKSTNNSDATALVIAAYEVQEPVAINKVEILELEVYPNPVTDVLYVRSDVKIEHLNIFDLNGRKLITTANVGNGVDVSALSQGVYILKVTTEDKENVVRFVKK